MLASRSTGVNHLVTTHGYDHQEALRLLQRAPPAPPGDRTAPQKCPYCPRICPTVASVNRHVVAMHRDEARIKRARPAPQPAAPSAPHDHMCHLCSFASGTKGGLTSHLLRTHNFDRRLPKRHRSSDCEESVEHLLFHCPRFAALRMKHGIRPPGDAKQWFERRVPDFLREALQLFDDEWLRRAGATPSAISSLQKPATETRVSACAKYIFYKCKPIIKTAANAAAALFGCASRPLKRRERD